MTLEMSILTGAIVTSGLLLEVLEWPIHELVICRAGMSCLSVVQVHKEGVLCVLVSIGRATAARHELEESLASLRTFAARNVMFMRSRCDGHGGLKPWMQKR